MSNWHHSPPTPEAPIGVAFHPVSGVQRLYEMQPNGTLLICDGMSREQLLTVLLPARFIKSMDDLNDYLDTTLETACDKPEKPGDSAPFVLADTTP